MKEKIARIQKEIGKLQKTKEGYNYNYFDINQLLEKLQPLLEREGLVLTQPLTYVGTETVRPAIQTCIEEKEGDGSIKSITVLPDLSDAQKMGGVITYFRRYSLVSLLALQAEDDDAQSVSRTDQSSDDLDL